jgi:sulfotransferase family protein
MSNDPESRVASRPSPQEAVRVLFVMGCGRSGSTMLDAILGSHSSAAGFGELCYAAEKAYLNGAYCACGEWGFACPFWAAVRQEWADRTGTSDVARFASLVRTVESRKLRLNRAVRAWRSPDSPFQEYAGLMKAFFDSLRAVSGKAVIVDSSKRPARALALSMIPGIDVRLIHLIRDVRGVVWSAKKRLKQDERGGVSNEDRGKTLVRSVAVWSIMNRLSEDVRRRLPASHTVQVRYEDYVTRPSDVLDRIGEVAELDFSALGAKLTAGAPVEIGHAIAGNRMRMATEIRLRADTEWITRLSPRERRMCWALAGRQLRRYGYQYRGTVESTSAAERAA